MSPGFRPKIRAKSCGLFMSVYSILFFASSGKDFMCVQSTDGMLSFFEQESFAFGRFLPGFLLPGPLTYVAKTDSFLTVSSSLLVESYKYVHACFTIMKYYPISPG